MESGKRGARFLYGTCPGRMCLKVLTIPWISEQMGRILNTRLSGLYIPVFIRKHHVDMTQFEKKKYRSFNDFFMRRLAPGSRKIASEEESLISPCDGRLLAYRISGSCAIKVKNSVYRMADLLGDGKLAAEYHGGLCLVYRLCPEDYHHYCHIDDGIIVGRRCIPGILHCVKPIATETVPVYTRNTREYTVIDTEHFGTIIQMEVGALLVGKICNRTDRLCVARGMEKGHFEFGGSTIIILLRKGMAELRPDLIDRSRRGTEVMVRMGEKIGIQGKMAGQEVR